MILAVTNEKGGVGKTTTVVNLGAILAVEHQKRVLIVDLDPQAHATLSFLAHVPDKRHTIYPVLLGLSSIQDVIVPLPDYKDLALAPSCLDLSAAELALLSYDSEYRNTRLREALEPVQEEYDYILVDCPPSLGVLSINALVAARKVLIPLTLEELPLHALVPLLKTLIAVHSNFNPLLEPFGLLPTKVERTRLNNRIINEIKIGIRIPGGNGTLRVKLNVLPPIPKSVRVAEAPGAKKALIYYAPDHPATWAYREVARRVLEEI